ncbi:MAG TPA: hypothetical protein VF924_02840 [Stellaceae bacterium]
MRYRGFYPLASQVGKTLVGGIDPNKPRMRQVIEALIALSPSPNGFTASEVAARVRALSKQSPCQYGPRHAGYNLKKLRGKHIVRRIGHTNFDFFSLTRACARETKKTQRRECCSQPWELIILSIAGGVSADPSAPHRKQQPQKQHDA